MKLDKIILQLTDDDYKALVNQLRIGRSDKYLSLTEAYRKNKFSEAYLMKFLELKPAAFYTLKSRLYDKIQDFLYQTTDSHLVLLKNISNITDIINGNSRDVAIGILKRLESELIQSDMPDGLIAVYKGLVKLNIYSTKYYGYLQLYNKHIAFNLAHDKAEELLTMFCKTLGEYYLDRNETTMDILVLYKKEMQNVCKVYQSHHLQFYKNILDIQFALFLPNSDEIENDSTVEDLLKESFFIVNTHSKDKIYKYLRLALEYLSFEYYHKLRLHKNANVYFEKVKDNFKNLFFIKHSCFASHFFISEIDHCLSISKDNILQDFKNEPLIFEPDNEDPSSMILSHCNEAARNFYSQNYPRTIHILNNLLTENSFKNISFFEIEIKLFLGFVYLLLKDYDNLEIILRSISRKIADENNEIRDIRAIIFLKFLKLGANFKIANKYEKLIEAYQLFNSVKREHYGVLDYMKFDSVMLKKIASS